MFSRSFKPSQSHIERERERGGHAGTMEGWSLQILFLFSQQTNLAGTVRSLSRCTQNRNSPYAEAKKVQLVDPGKAIPLFWAAINEGDEVDSALKDMAFVLKQQNRPAEAIEAIKSFRHKCSKQAQEPLDNILLDLFKRCGRLDDQIALLRRKLRLIEQGMAFNGKRTKTARSQGRKLQVSVEQEATRLLGNLDWALNYPGAATKLPRSAIEAYSWRSVLKFAQLQ